jgi:xanthine dehydrogenase iron-sulfur cluster and FAD-binding subunit A
MTHSQTSAGRSARTTENTAEISLEVNGISRRLAVDPRTSLLDLLRERLGLTGPKKGCDHGRSCPRAFNGGRSPRMAHCRSRAKADFRTVSSDDFGIKGKCACRRFVPALAGSRTTVRFS